MTVLAMPTPNTDSLPQFVPDQAVALVGVQTPVPIVLLPAANWNTPPQPVALLQLYAPEVLVLSSSPTKTYTNPVLESTSGAATMPLLPVAASWLLFITAAPAVV